MQATPEGPTGGPTLWWVWGDLKERLSEVRSLSLSNRQAVLDQVVALQKRQDDMRREWLYHNRLLRERLDARKPALHWAMRLPWDKLIGIPAGILGIMGYLKPEWVRLLMGH